MQRHRFAVLLGMQIAFLLQFLRNFLVMLRTTKIAIWGQLADFGKIMPLQGKNVLSHDDQFCPSFVKIGTILAYSYTLGRVKVCKSVRVLE